MYLVAHRPMQPNANGARKVQASTIPHIHPDEALAVQEASRLAGVYKDKEFLVFKAVASVRLKPVEQPVEVEKL